MPKSKVRKGRKKQRQASPSLKMLNMLLPYTLADHGGRVQTKNFFKSAIAHFRGRQIQVDADFMYIDAVRDNFLQLEDNNMEGTLA